MVIIRLFFILTFITGVIYPLSVTLVSQLAFSEKAEGSLVKSGDKIVGSSLIAQKSESEGLFHSRPSAADYATVSSGASQASPTHREAKDKREVRKLMNPTAGIDLWTTSGSGLDPHISPKSALAQITRIAKATGLPEVKLSEMILQNSDGPTWGIWGQPRVNVLELNIALLKEVNVHTGSAASEP